MLFTDGGEERAQEIFSRYNIDKKVCMKLDFKVCIETYLI